MDPTVATTIGLFDTFNGKEISVIAILVLIIYAVVRVLIYFWKKHEVDMKTLNDKHEKIIEIIKKEYSDIITKMETNHTESIKAQREAHLHEKTEFFSNLNKTLGQLADAIQVSNEIRNKISFDLAQIQKYQDEIRREIEFFKKEQAIIKNTLLHNADILSSLIKCDLTELLKESKE